MTYTQAVDWLRKPRANRNMADAADDAFFLERMRVLQEAAGIELAFCGNVLHVAGTAGKGSTAMMLYEGLRAAGLRTGVFLSPHVTTDIEDIQVNGLCIAPEQFAEYVQTLQGVVEKIEPQFQPSYYELLFAVALMEFARVGCEWIVVEVGWGGRYDMTNIVEPQVSVITTIDYDHQAVLGQTLSEIASHKAGIIKKGVPVFSHMQHVEVQDVLNEEAAGKQTQVTYVEPTQHLTTGLPGLAQQQNAATVDAVLASLGVNQAAREKGIAALRLPARFEVLQRQPFVLMDGAHSPVKMQALVEAIQNHYPEKQWTILLAIKKGKDIAGILKPLQPITSNWVITTFLHPVFPSYEAHEIAKHLPNTTVVTHPQEALEYVLDSASEQDNILITGSLYLSGQLRQHWINESEMLRTRSPFGVNKI